MHPELSFIGVLLGEQTADQDRSTDHSGDPRGHRLTPYAHRDRGGPDDEKTAINDRELRYGHTRKLELICHDYIPDVSLWVELIRARFYEPPMIKKISIIPKMIDRSRVLQ